MILGGATGLLGQALARALASAGYECALVGRPDLDVTDQDSLTACINKFSPAYIVNTIAYTQVELAEEQEQEALLLNRALPSLLGRIVKNTSMYLVHYSTDFVFNGKKTTPYTEDDVASPLCVYGQSKLEGEQALLRQNLDNCCIVRTAWLFGPGKKNFVQTMINLAVQKKSLSVVADQIGSPTYTADLAQYSLKLLTTKPSGIVHIVNAGQASWCELAAETMRLTQMECLVTPVPSAAYPQKAMRPPYSVLSTERFTKLTGSTPRPWPQALADYINTEFLQAE